MTLHKTKPKATPTCTHCLVQGIEEGKIVDGWKARKPKYVPPFVSAEQ
jgi:hypothetical protein